MASNAICAAMLLARPWPRCSLGIVIGYLPRRFLPARKAETASVKGRITPHSGFQNPRMLRLWSNALWPH